MKKLCTIIVVILMTLTLTACQGAQTRNWNISGMNCAACERSVRTILEDIGVTVVSISAREDSIEFEFDPSDISEADIIQALEYGGYRIIE